nr:ComF family protein [Eubacterium sp.]
MCGECQRKLAVITEPRCKRCSKTIPHMEMEFCEDCSKRTFLVEKGFALYPYDKNMKKAIRNFKYEGELSGGMYFAGKLVEYYGAWIRGIAPDAILPVPIHKNRRRFRGFNQAEYVAEIVGRELGIAVPVGYLLRTEDTLPQKKLDVKGRINNLRKGFAVQENRAPYETVLLVDDIYTTGATLEACAMVLKEAGTRRIYFLCLCIGMQ